MSTGASRRAAWNVSTSTPSTTSAAGAVGAAGTAGSARRSGTDTTTTTTTGGGRPSELVTAGATRARHRHHGRHSQHDNPTRPQGLGWSHPVSSPQARRVVSRAPRPPTAAQLEHAARQAVKVAAAVAREEEEALRPPPPLVVMEPSRRPFECETNWAVLPGLAATDWSVASHRKYVWVGVVGWLGWVGLVGLVLRDGTGSESRDRNRDIGTVVGALPS